MFSFDRAMQHHMHPGTFVNQFSPGMQITVTIPGSPPISGTFIQFIPPSTAKIQLQNGSIQLVDIHQISTASAGGGFPSGGGWIGVGSLPGGGFVI